MEKKRVFWFWMKIAAVGFFLLLLAIVLFAYIKYSETGENIKEKEPDFCEKDSECAPASCCHSVSCVSKKQAPLCIGIYCTQDCKPETLDCRQAYCSCINNKCEKVNNENYR